MSGSSSITTSSLGSPTTTTAAPPLPRTTEANGRYIIVQPSGTGLTMLIDTLTGRSWFRIAAGADHYAWRPMQFEPSAAPTPR
jgi:hypothetical protein